jgi:hypothetical protein
MLRNGRGSQSRALNWTHSVEVHRSSNAAQHRARKPEVHAEQTQYGALGTQKRRWLSLQYDWQLPARDYCPRAAPVLYNLFLQLQGVEL